MNAKGGLFRLWIVGSIIWVVFSINKWDAGYHADYAFQYYFQNEKLVDKYSIISCSTAEAVNQYLGKRIENTVAQKEEQEYDSCINGYKPHNPDWTWALWAFLLPTLGVGLALLFLRLLFSISRWVWNGFAP